MSTVARVAGTILALGSAFIPSVATAQRPGDMTIGVMAGLNWAKVEQDPEFGDVTFHYRRACLREGFSDTR